MTTREQQLRALIVGIVVLILAALALIVRLELTPSATPTATLRQVAPPLTPVPTPPAAYAELYGQVSSNVSALEVALAVPTATPTPTPHEPLLLGAELGLASGNRGTDLLSPGVMIGVDRQLDAMARLGVQAVNVHIPYPLLLPGTADDAGYLDFYKTMAQDVRERGMALVVARGNYNTAVAAGGSFPAFTYPPYCTYEAQQQQITQRIIDELSPAIEVIFNEPASWYQFTGYTAFDPKGGTAGALAYVAYLAGSAPDPACPSKAVVPLRKGTPKTRIIAGQGNWDTADYAAGYAQIPELDGIDLHVYNAISSTVHPYVAALPTVAAIARSGGKEFDISELWPNKVTEDELTAAYTQTYALIQARSVFSFWQPVDSAFVASMVQFAAREEARYLSVSYSGYFDAYLDYTPGVFDETTAPSVLQLAASRAQDANRAARGPFTQLGVSYCQLIAAASGASKPCLALTPWPTPIPPPTRTPLPTRTPQPTRTPRTP